jgi:hypothetical protein
VQNTPREVYRVESRHVTVKGAGPRVSVVFVVDRAVVVLLLPSQTGVVVSDDRPVPVVAVSSASRAGR